MPISDDIHKSVSRLLLDYCNREYSETVETWRNLEQKAQGTTAIVGIFIAGALLLGKDGGPPYPIERVLLFLAVTCLVGAAVAALLSLRVRSFEGLEDYSSICDGAKKVLGTADDDKAKESLREFVFQRADAWHEASDALDRQNSSKAAHVAVAQYLVLIGAVMLLLVFGARLVDGGMP